MNLTEEEAKQRWCPFAHVGFGGRFGGAAFNRFQITGQTAAGQVVDEGELKIPAGAKCIASACMAWRWQYDTQTDVEEERAAQLQDDGWEAISARLISGPIGPVAVISLRRRTLQGRCGLAG